MVARNMITCVYQDDNLKNTLKRQDTRYQSQLNGAVPPAPLFGGVVATANQLGTLTNAPDDLKPRHVLVATADGAFRGKIACYTNAAYIALVVGAAVTFYDGQGVSHAGVVTGHVGERQKQKTDIS